MNTFVLRDATIDDGEEIVTLNATSVAVTSPMDNARFRQLLDLCALTIVAESNGRIVGFLMGMTDGCAYDNGNYRWFAERLRRFVYIDRVVVSQACRSSGVGRALYAHVQSWAKQAQLLSIAAEMDIDPPNKASLSFHQKEGFTQIGRRTLDNGKHVSMQIRCLVLQLLLLTLLPFSPAVAGENNPPSATPIVGFDDRFDINSVEAHDIVLSLVGPPSNRRLQLVSGQNTDWPGITLKPSTTSDQPVVGTDVLATMAAVAGVKVPADQAKDSLNLLPLLTGSSDFQGREMMLLQGGSNNELIFYEGPWKLIIQSDHPLSKFEPVALFNIDDNSMENENQNLVNHQDHQERVKAMHDKYMQIRNSGVRTAR